MSRRKRTPEENLESLRVHAFLFCEEAGIPKGEVVASIEKLADGTPVYVIASKVVPSFSYSGRDFSDVETWICGARNGLLVSKGKVTR